MAEIAARDEADAGGGHRLDPGDLRFQLDRVAGALDLLLGHAPGPGMAVHHRPEIVDAGADPDAVAPRLERGERGVVDEAGMVDNAHPAARRHRDACRAARMDGDEGAVPISLVDRGRDHRVAHIEILGREAVDDTVARDEHLDRADALVALARDQLADRARVGGDLHQPALVTEATGRGEHRPARHDARTGDIAALDRRPGEQVVMRLGGARADDHRVAALDIGPGHRGDVECVLGRGRRRHRAMIEHEIERPADMGVGVAETRQHRRAVHVDPSSSARVHAHPPRRNGGDTLALDQHVTVERPLIGVAGATEHPGVGDQNALNHLFLFVGGKLEPGGPEGKRLAPTASGVHSK